MNLFDERWSGPPVPLRLALLLAVLSLPVATPAAGAAASTASSLAVPARSQDARADTAPPRPLAVDDLFRIRAVGDAKVSPDGRWIAYAVSSTSLEEEERATRLWMVPTDGGDAIPLTAEEGSASSPAWSPDGRYLSFTAARGDGAKTQVWVLDRRGGEARRLTDVKQGVNGYVWSPDGSRLALTIRDPEEAGDSAKAKKKDAPEKPWVIDRLQFKRDGQGYLTGERRTHLYVFDLASKTLRQLTDGRWDEGSPAWSPDGRWIAFSSNRTEDPDANTDSDLWVVPADAEKSDAPRRLTDYPGRDASPAWSPDGRRIAYVTGTHDPRFDMYATAKLALIPFVPAGRDVPARRILADALDRNVSSPTFSADGRAVLVGLEDEGTRQVARVEAAGDAVARVVGGEVDAAAWDLGPDGLVAAVVSTPDRPGEVFVVRGTETPRRVSHVNDSVMATLRLGAVENVHYPSRDGTEIEGWIVTPPDFRPGTRYPTILRLHGGPNGQYDVGFNFEAQLLAAQGYVVVFTNPRGSSGYGQAFGMALWQRWGEPDFEDVMAGVDLAVARGLADPDRLGVGGWSYGGILTNYVITKTNRFQAAITGASMALLTANYGHDHYQLSNEKEWGLPWETPELWASLSPFNDVGRIETPTLVMGGEQDWNVPIQNSEQLYQALRRRGVPTQLVVYPGQPHGLRVPSYQKDRYERYIAWYDRWVKAKPKTVSEGGAGRP